MQDQTQEEIDRDGCAFVIQIIGRMSLSRAQHAFSALVKDAREQGIKLGKADLDYEKCSRDLLTGDVNAECVIIISGLAPEGGELVEGAAQATRKLKQHGADFYESVYIRQTGDLDLLDENAVLRADTEAPESEKEDA